MLRDFWVQEIERPYGMEEIEKAACRSMTVGWSGPHRGDTSFLVVPPDALRSLSPVPPLNPNVQPPVTIVQTKFGAFRVVRTTVLAPALYVDCGRHSNREAYGAQLPQPGLTQAEAVLIATAVLAASRAERS